MKYIKKKLHEDNLKLQLNWFCHHNGIYLEMEYRHKNCRFDAVVVRKGEILAIIEVKNWQTIKHARTKTKTTPKQLKKYLSFGVPVLVLWKVGGLKQVYQKIKNIVNRFDERGCVVHPHELLYFPAIKEKRQAVQRREELNKLIEQQANAMRWGHMARVS